MGDWTMRFSGTGPFGNGSNDDADAIARRLVVELESHTLESAIISCGDQNIDLLAPAKKEETSAPN